MNLIYADIQVVNSLFLQTENSPKDSVLDYVISDPVFLHAALAHSALNLCNLRPEKAPESLYLNLFYHRAQSIRLLNNRIKSSNIAAAFHTTVGAISCLTNAEVPARPLLSPYLLRLISNFLYRLRWKEGDSMVSRFI
jgi:hypothetical protein